MTFNITPVNDAPVLTPFGPNLPTISVDQTNNSGQLISTTLANSVTDADTNALEGVAITSLQNTVGTWQFSTNGGTSWSPIGSVSQTSALLLRATDSVRFVPDGSTVTTASFTYRAWDQTSGAVGTKVNVSTNGGTTAFSTASDTAHISVNLQIRNSVRLGADPFNAAGNALLIDGTDGSDLIEVRPSNLGDSAIVTINSVFRGTFHLAGLTRIVVKGHGGDDRIYVSKGMPSAYIDGGDGNNTIVGGNGNDMILGGGAGNNNIFSHGGSVVQIGGSGASQLHGGLGSNLLIAGSTNFDTNDAALGAILNEWSSKGTPQTHEAHLAGILPGGLNGSFLLNNSTVHASSAMNHIETGPDFALAWIFAQMGDTTNGGILDSIHGSSHNRLFTQIT
jgi:hypothetical protein